MKIKKKDKIRTVEEWVKTHGDELYSWAYHKTAKREIAEDLVQETFLSAFKYFNSFQGKSSPKTWLFKILNNKIIDHYRKTVRTETEKHNLANDPVFLNTAALFDKYGNWTVNGWEAHWEDHGNLLDNPEFKHIMDICMDDLPLHWQKVVTMKYLSERNSREICQELGISLSNFWQITHRSMLLLKKCIELKWFEKDS
ncbi:sigma-70 family RNA polymerase sigma factor [Echinicola sediminis]